MKVTLVVVGAAATLASIGVPANTVPGLLRLSLLAADGTVTATKDVDPASPTTVFPSIADGAYTAVAQSLTSDGANLGQPVSAPVTVVTPVDGGGTPPAATDYFQPGSINVLVEADDPAPVPQAPAA